MRDFGPLRPCQEVRAREKSSHAVRHDVDRVRAGRRHQLFDDPIQALDVRRASGRVAPVIREDAVVLRSITGRAEDGLEAEICAIYRKTVGVEESRRDDVGVVRPTVGRELEDVEEILGARGIPGDDVRPDLAGVSGGANHAPVTVGDLDVRTGGRTE